jgi:ParB-like chromosome segregation protein Spo0J
MELLNIPLAEIMVGDRVLPLDPDNVARLVDSIKLLGFTSAISVYQREDYGYDLVSGCHRLHAAAEVGLSHIPALVFPVGTPAHLIVRNELMENLVRRVLTAAEKSLHIQRLIKSLEADGGANSAQVLEQLRTRMQMSQTTLETYAQVADVLTEEELEQLRNTSGDTVKALTNLADMTPQARRRRIERIREEEQRVASVNISHLAARRTADILSTKLRPSEIAELIDQLNRTTLKQVAVQLESIVELRGRQHV